MESIQDFLISNCNLLLEITLQSYPCYVTLLILAIHAIVQTTYQSGATMYTRAQWQLEIQNINQCANSDYHLWFHDINSCNSFVFIVYVPITSCHISYMPIHTTWFYAFLLLHGATLHQLNFTVHIWLKIMELACVVSPVESFEDINNLSSLNLEKESYPTAPLGEIVLMIQLAMSGSC